MQKDLQGQDLENWAALPTKSSQEYPLLPGGCRGAGRKLKLCLVAGAPFSASVSLLFLNYCSILYSVTLGAFSCYCFFNVQVLILHWLHFLQLFKLEPEINKAMQPLAPQYQAK